MGWLQYVRVALFGVLRCTLCAAIILGICKGAAAQSPTPPIVVGVFPFPPFIQIAPDGTPSGYMVELSEAVAAEAGLQLSFRQFDGVQPFFDAQINGDTHLMAGVATLPPLRSGNGFSEPIAKARVRIAVRTEDAEETDVVALTGKKIGYLPPTVGSSEQAFLDANLAIEFASVEAALVALLSEEVDALLIAEVAVYNAALRARLDHRITFVGAPIREFDRVIAVHNNRSDVQGRIFDAVETLRESGQLTELRQKYFLDLPPPPPEVLRVGVFHFPPYTVVSGDDTFTGHAVESLRGLAERADLKLSFEEITLEQWRTGPGPGRYDMLPQAGINAERRNRMDFTAPVKLAPLSIFMRMGQADGVRGLDDLAGLKVGVQEANLAYQMTRDRKDFELVLAEDPEALLQSLLDGTVDAILYPTEQVRQQAERLGVQDRIHEVEPPFYTSQRAPALRFGLGEVRERLNVVIPGYLISEEAIALRAQWFGEADPNNSEHLRVVLVSSGILVFTAFLIALAAIFWRRQTAFRERRRYAMELVDKIPIGLLLISPTGVIEFSNAELTDQTPDGDEVLVVGADYREAIRELIVRGIIDTGSRTQEDMLDHMTIEGLEDGFSAEYGLANGGRFVRSTKRLRDGSKLLMRVDVTTERMRMKEIDDLNKRLSHQITVAKAANEELRSFAYSTSHDLKAPTNTMLMLIDALRQGLDGKIAQDDTDLLKDLAETARRMGQLIDDVLDYTNAIGSRPVFEMVDLEHILDEALQSLRADIDQNGAVIERNSMPVLQANPVQMRQLMQNLIGNAIKFRSEDRTPQVSIRASDPGDGRVLISVSDNGIGIPAKHRERVFRIFSRLHANQRYEGTGMGLAICQRIALNHGGKIKVQAADPHGTCFTVTLMKDPPVHQPDSEAGEADIPSA